MEHRAWCKEGGIPRNQWHRIPLDLDAEPTAEPEPEPLPAPLPPSSTQETIDRLCRTLAEHYGPVEVTGALLGNIARILSEAVGIPVIATVIPTGHGTRLVGYPAPGPNAQAVQMEPEDPVCGACSGRGTFLRPIGGSTWTGPDEVQRENCFRCNGTGREPRR